MPGYPWPHASLDWRDSDYLFPISSFPCFLLFTMAVYVCMSEGVHVRVCVYIHVR